MNKAAQAYFQTKVSTTDQGQLLLLLYDGALKFLQQAREKMIEKDYAAKGILISKVIDIVNELSNTLNLEKGGTLAENLNNLYFLCTTRLLQANLKMNVEQLDSVTTILSGLRSAYAQIINTPEAQKISAQISVKLNAEASMTQRGAHITAPVAAPMPIGQLQARAAYGQMTRSVGEPSPTSVSSPAALPAASATQTLAPPSQSPALAQATVTAMPEQATMPSSSSSVAKPALKPAPASAAPSTSEGAPSAPKGFAAPTLNKRMAAYGKM